MKVGVKVLFSPSREDSVVIEIKSAPEKVRAPGVTTLASDDASVSGAKEPTAKEIEAMTDTEMMEYALKQSLASASPNYNRDEWESPGKAVAPSIGSAETTAERIALTALGNTCFVGYPYLNEAKVLTVYDREGSWRANKKGAGLKRVNGNAKEWDRLCTEVAADFLERYAINLGKTECILEALPLYGMVVRLDGSSLKQFSDEPILVPAQLIPCKGPRLDARFVERGAISPKERFPIGQRCIYLGEAWYGELAEVEGCKMRDDGNGGHIPVFSAIIPAARTTRAYSGTVRVGKAARDAWAQSQAQYIPAFKGQFLVCF